MQLCLSYPDIIIHGDRYGEVIINHYGLWSYLILFLIILCETGVVVTPSRHPRAVCGKHWEHGLLAFCALQYRGGNYVDSHCGIRRILLWKYPGAFINNYFTKLGYYLLLKILSIYLHQ